MGVVPYQSQTRDAVKTQVLHAHPEFISPHSFSFCMFEPQGGRDGCGEQAITGKHPIIGISSTNAVIVIIYFSYFQLFNNSRTVVSGLSEYQVSGYSRNESFVCQSVLPESMIRNSFVVLCSGQRPQDRKNVCD